MAEEEIVDEEETTEEAPEDQEETTSVEDDFKAPATLEEATQRLRKAEKAIVKSKRTPPPKQTTSKPDGDMPDWAKKAEDRETKRDFAEEHNLTKAQTEAVFRYNGGSAPDEETLNSVPVQAMIKALGAKDRVAANTPKGRNAPVHKGKTFAEIATDKEASKEDKHAGFEAMKKRHGIA